MGVFFLIPIRLDSFHGALSGGGVFQIYTLMYPLKFMTIIQVSEIYMFVIVHMPIGS